MYLFRKISCQKYHNDEIKIYNYENISLTLFFDFILTFARGEN